MIQITLRQRVRGGWGKFIKRESTAAEVGTFLIQDEVYRGKPADARFRGTKIGQLVMVNFSGTMTEIGRCYEAAGPEIYRRWLDSSSVAGNAVIRR